jgi:hypothetical protein
MRRTQVRCSDESNCGNAAVGEFLRRHQRSSIPFSEGKKMSISANDVIRQIEDIVASDIDDEKVMMSIEKGCYYGLDPTGSRVWELIEAPIRVSELIDVLLLKYDVDRQTCEVDVLSFLQELYEAGVLRVEG